MVEAFNDYELKRLAPKAKCRKTMVEAEKLEEALLSS